MMIKSKLLRLSNENFINILRRMSKRMMIYILLSMSSFGFSQKNSFLPLTTDNKWQFDVSGLNDTVPISGTESMFVLKDTMINNQSCFKVKIPGHYFPTPFNLLRYDSLSNSIMEFPLYHGPIDSEKTFLDFNISVNEEYDSFWGEVRCIKDDTTLVFEESKHIKGYIFGGIPSYSIEVVENFGPIYMYDDQGFVVTNYRKYEIIYAQVNGTKYGKEVTLIDKHDIPLSWFFYQNYPNPFNPQTTLKYALPTDQSIYKVKLEIYNTLGQIVHALVDANQNPGLHTVKWNAGDVPSGIYFAVLKAGQFTATQKMLLVR